LIWSFEHGMTVRRAGAGPELVWIHGLGEASTAFDDIASRIPGFTHVLPDLPGYGRSPWVEPMGLSALADHLAPWLTDRVLIGHSMGGVLATLIAERAPVRAVINIDGNISPGDCTFSGRALEVGFAQLKGEVLAKPGVPASYFAAMCFASPEMFLRHARDLVDMSAALDLAPRFAALRVPALFIAGVPDGICAESRALLDRAGARWVGIENAGHWVYLDAPEPFAAEVTKFLS
jgi:pimeloyl-ACP methyl ester carboxylesterase